MTSVSDIQSKADAFYKLHLGPKAFIIPNAWDRGSARILAHLGFRALATTSMGYAFSLGRLDYTLSRDETLAHVADLAAATDLPVSADLENGFGESPETVAETIRLAGATGIVGGSIEDSTGNPDAPIYDFGLAVERVEAAVEAAKSLPFKFTLTARAENYLQGRPILEDTIKRLQAFEKAGADVVYAPALRTREVVTSLVSALTRPVNVGMGVPDLRLTLDDLSAIGVKRISQGSALARAAMGAFMRAASEMRDKGTFSFGAEAATPSEISNILREFQSRT